MKGPQGCVCMVGLECVLWSRSHFQPHLIGLVFQRDLSGALIQRVRGSDKSQGVRVLCLARGKGKAGNMELGGLDLERRFTDPENTWDMEARVCR